MSPEPWCSVERGAGQPAARSLDYPPGSSRDPCVCRARHTAAYAAAAVRRIWH